MDDNSLIDYSPPEWLQLWLDHIPPGRCLDLGAGEGHLTRWLAQRGFKVTAVEQDSLLAANLGAPGSSTVSVVELDITQYQPDPESFSLVVAAAVLHFIHPRSLPKVADRLISAMKPGAVFMAEVLTVDDPSYAIRLESQETVAEDTFAMQDRPGLIHYFQPSQLSRLFRRLHVLDYREERRRVSGDRGGFRAGASLVARRLER